MVVMIFTCKDAQTSPWQTGMWARNLHDERDIAPVGLGLK